MPDRLTAYEWYSRLLPWQKAAVLFGSMYGLLIIVTAVLGLMDNRNVSKPASYSIPQLASDRLPASWREACDYVYTYGAGRLPDDHCAKLVRERPAGLTEAEWVRRIKIGNQRAECIREARTAQGKDACRMQYPANW